MTNRVIKTAAVAILLAALVTFVLSCSDSDAGMSRAEVVEVVRSELAKEPAPPEPGTSVAEVERIVQEALENSPQASVMLRLQELAGTELTVAPPKSTPDDYTRYLVESAIDKYKSEGLDATVAYYNMHLRASTDSGTSSSATRTT